MGQDRSFTVVVETDEDGVFVASCPALPGAHGHGPTREAAIADVTIAAGLVLEDMRERGEPIPSDSDVTTSEIQLAV